MFLYIGLHKYLKYLPLICIPQNQKVHGLKIILSMYFLVTFKLSKNKPPLSSLHIRSLRKHRWCRFLSLLP